MYSSVNRESAPKETGAPSKEERARKAKQIKNRVFIERSGFVSWEQDQDSKYPIKSPEKKHKTTSEFRLRIKHTAGHCCCELNAKAQRGKDRKERAKEGQRVNLSFEFNVDTVIKQLRLLPCSLFRC
jgi:hypothetical protein